MVINKCFNIFVINNKRDDITLLLISFSEIVYCITKQAIITQERSKRILALAILVNLMYRFFEFIIATMLRVYFEGFILKYHGYVLLRNVSIWFLNSWHRLALHQVDTVIIIMRSYWATNLTPCTSNITQISQIINKNRKFRNISFYCDIGFV